MAGVRGESLKAKRLWCVSCGCPQDGQKAYSASTLAPHWVQYPPEAADIGVAYGVACERWAEARRDSGDSGLALSEGE